jgi:subtilisin family serine protease
MAHERGAVPLIVGLATETPFRPEGKLASTATVDRQRQMISKAQEELLASLEGSKMVLNARYRFIPYMALSVDGEGLERLLASPLVTTVSENSLSAPLLDSSVPLIGAEEVWTAGYDGSGWAVAVIDTGIQWDHEFLGGADGSRVIAEACFSLGEDFFDPGAAGSLCISEPPHEADVIIPLCQYDDYNICGHGTHVAGIAAGSHLGASVDYDGVAPGADIIAIQVFSYFADEHDVLSWQSDQIFGLEAVYEMSSRYDIASVNMSLGSGEVYTEPCDSDPRAAAIDNLRSVGIAVVVSSGNVLSASAVSAPACISSAIAVGSVNDDSSLDLGSSNGELVDLLAPGIDVTSSIPDNSYQSKNGTSMAAPHVAGAWALLRQVEPTASVDKTLELLKLTGDPVLDSRSGLVKPRINLSKIIDYMDGGTLSGGVFDDQSSSGLAGAVVTAQSPDHIIRMVTDSNGAYSSVVPADTYDVTAVAYGYQTQLASGITVRIDEVTSHDFFLPASDSFHVVEGVIRDATIGLPIYASITVAGNPVSPPQTSFWNDPVTGYYHLTLAEGVSYSLTINAWTTGLLPANHTLEPLTADIVLDLSLEADTSCTAPGYGIEVVPLITEDFESWPPSGWSIYAYSNTSCLWYGDDSLEAVPEGNLTGGSGGFADADADSCGGYIETTLESPPFDASGYPTIVVELMSHLEVQSWYSGGGYIGLVDGDDWRPIWSADDSSSAPVRAEGVSVSTETRVSFDYFGSIGERWWQIDEVRIGGGYCATQNDSGLVVGTITDANTGVGLIGASVSSQSGGSTTTGLTPDPAVADGFFSLSSPQGMAVLTAEADGYASQTQTISVPANGVVRLDLSLDAPAIELTPSKLSEELGGVATVAQSLTIANPGGVDLEWMINYSEAWAAASPIEGAVAAGQSSVVEVVFDSTDLGPGLHTGSLSMYSTAPTDQYLTVPLELTVMSGTLSGHLTVAETGEPVGWALVTVMPGSFEVYSNEIGEYSIELPVYNDYAVRVEAFGQTSAEATGVAVAEDRTTTLDLQLDTIERARISGKVRDGGDYGWPLPARIAISSYLYSNEVYTDPATGQYAVDLPRGVPVTFTVTALSGGYVAAQREVMAGSTESFSLAVDVETCTAPGYTRSETVLLEEDFTSWPPPGWSVVDNAGNGCVWSDDSLEDNPEGNHTDGMGSFADADSDDCGSENIMDSDLISPLLDTSVYDVVMVSFTYEFDNESSVEGHVDLFDGQAWTTLWTAPAGSRGSVGVIHIGPTAGTQIRFHYRDTEWGFWWQLDDVRVTGLTCSGVDQQGPARPRH